MQFTSLHDKEMAAQERYAQNLIDSKKREKDQHKKCSHDWQVVSRESNKLVRKCTRCGEYKVSQWTSEQRQFAEKNKADFAQPGTALWDKTKHLRD